MSVKQFVIDNKFKISIGIIVVLLLVGIFNIVSRKTQLPGNPFNSASNNNTIPKTSQINNPLINGAELYEVNNTIKPPTNQNTPIKFHYKLAPELINRKQSFFNDVYALEQCGIDTLGSQTTIYVLKNHLTKEDATIEAERYGILSSTYAIPKNNVTFQYFFTDSYHTGLFSQFESSGVSYFAKIGFASSTARSLDTAKNNVTKELIKHKLTDNFVLDTVKPTSDGFHFIYTKTWKDFNVVDTNSLEQIFSAGLCPLPTAKSMNHLHVLTKSDNTIAKIADFTRKTNKSETVDTVSLSKALTLYGEQPLTLPLVDPHGSVTQGTVTIDKVAVAYFDYGYLFAQAVYAPVYITLGTVEGTKTRVISIFPAIDKESVESLGVIPPFEREDLKKFDLSQKQSFFELESLSPPPEVPLLNSTEYELLQTGFEDFTVDTPTETTTYSEEGGACVGRKVDYVVSCEHRGTAVCSGSISIPENLDTLNTCENGCTSHQKSLNIGAKEDACKKYLESLGVHTEDYEPFNFYSSSTSESVICDINVCPL